MKYGILGATGRVGQLLVKILKDNNEKIGAVMFNQLKTSAYTNIYNIHKAKPYNSYHIHFKI